MPLSQGRNADLSESSDGYSTSPWESPKSTASENLNFTYTQRYVEGFSWNSSCESNSIHDSEDIQTLESDKEDVNNCRGSKLRLFDSVLQNSVNLNSNEINGVTDHESKIIDSILKKSDTMESIQTIGIKEQEPPDVTLDLPYEKLDCNKKNSKLSNLMLEYPDHVDSYDLLAILEKPSYSPGSEGFPDNPAWDDVEGYSVNIEDSIIETMEDIEEFTRSRNFVCIFENLHSANHFHQAIQFLSNLLVCHIPPPNIIKKILDLMLVIDDEEYVIEAQAYLHQLITYYPPNCDALGQYYQIVLKEEEIEQKRVSSPKDPCGSFVNVLNQFETELGKIDQKNKNPPSKVSKCDNEEDSNDSSQSEDEEEAANTDVDKNDDVDDMSLLIGKNFKLWWNNATSKKRIHRLMCVLSIMMEIFELDLIRWKERTPEAQKPPLARPIISRLIWPYEDHGDPSVMLIRMITSMYSIAHKYDLFHCMTEFERLVSFVAAVLPSSPLDKGEGYPPDSHQRRVFAQYISNSLEDGISFLWPPSKFWHFICICGTPEYFSPKDVWKLLFFVVYFNNE